MELQTLRLERRVGREIEGRARDLVSGFRASTPTLADEVCGERFGSRNGDDAAGRHPVIRERDGARKIPRPELLRSVEAGLEHIAPPAPESLGQAPSGSATRERKTEHGVGRRFVVEAGGDPGRTG